MKNKLKRYQKILPVIIIPICLLIVAVYGWGFLATVAGRNGLNADMYMYYNMSQLSYSVYNFVIAYVAFSLIVLQIQYLFTANSRPLSKIFWVFLIFIGMIMLCEIYLQTRFVGKG